MKELIDNIYQHKNSNSPKICFFMMEYIRNRNINSLEELRKKEEGSYTLVNGKKYTDLEIVDLLYEAYDNDYDDYMACSLDDKNRLDELNEQFLNTDDMDTKFICLIKMYNILDWDLVLPYHAYMYILQDRL
jgi:hypothetical protein